VKEYKFETSDHLRHRKNSTGSTLGNNNSWIFEDADIDVFEGIDSEVEDNINSFDDVSDFDGDWDDINENSVSVSSSSSLEYKESLVGKELAKYSGKKFPINGIFIFIFYL
jgi:hypothetical protein